jgi:SAM-dependent methyltransferase
MCPLCKALQYKTVFSETGIATTSIVKCICCSHLYTKNEKDTGHDIYDNGTYQLVDSRKSIFSRILSWENNNILKKINRLTVSKDQLLDFGCGKGKFAAAAAKNGWKVKGIETSATRAAYAKEIYQLAVSTALYSQGKIFDGNFNVITLFHVLEHLEEPKTILNELTQHNLLKNGILIIEVPNPKSWQAIIAGKKWHHWDFRHHISHFKDQQLDDMVAPMDLIPVRTSYKSLHLGVVGMCDSLLKKFGYKGHVIWDLKTKRSFRIILCLVLPFATILEFTSLVFRKGGVIRKYYRKSSDTKQL